MSGAVAAAGAAVTEKAPAAKRRAGKASAGGPSAPAATPAPVVGSTAGASGRTLGQAPGGDPVRRTGSDFFTWAAKLNWRLFFPLPEV